MEQLPDRAQLRVPPGQRRLQAVDPLRAAHRRHDPGGPPQPLRLGLALQGVLAGVGEPDGLARQPLRRSVRQDLPGAGRGLDPGRGVHRVPGHHALADRAQVDRHLAGHHARAGGQPGHAGLGPERRDRGHQVQRGPDGAFGVALGRDGRPPHGHHRVADELLDRSAVAADHGPGHPEVAGQQLADGLGITRLGQRREAHQIAEQHRAHAPFGHRLAVRGGGVPGRRVLPDRRVPNGWVPPGWVPPGWVLPGWVLPGWAAGQLEAARPAETVAGHDLLATRRARSEGCTARSAEPVRRPQRRAALPASHATLLT